MQGVLYLGPSWGYGGAPPIQLNDVPLTLHQVNETFYSRTYTFEIPRVVELVQWNNIRIDGFYQVNPICEWNNSWVCASLEDTGCVPDYLPKCRGLFHRAGQLERCLVGIWRAPIKA